MKSPKQAEEDHSEVSGPSSSDGDGNQGSESEEEDGAADKQEYDNDDDDDDDDDDDNNYDDEYDNHKDDEMTEQLADDNDDDDDDKHKDDEMTEQLADDNDDDDDDNHKDDGMTEQLADADNSGSEGKVLESKKKKRKVHKLSMTQTEDFNAKLKKRGVVYIARVPPRMTPTKLKKMLQEISRVEVTRLYLVEEDASVRKRRRKEYGGNGSKRYVEGWVEFADKKVAKHVASSLNNTPMSNHKRNHHYGDLWNLKYLHKFQWSHLTEKVAYERRVKEQKLRLETMQARKETAAYKQLVETGQKLDKIQQRKARREQKQQKQTHRGDQDQPSLDIDTNNYTTHSQQKKRKRAKQLNPLDDGTHKATHASLLQSLV